MISLIFLIICVANYCKKSENIQHNIKCKIYLQSFLNDRKLAYFLSYVSADTDAGVHINTGVATDYAFYHDLSITLCYYSIYFKAMMSLG